MNFTQFILRDAQDVKSYIEGFTPDKVVLGDYFYSTNGDLFSNSVLYTDNQIGRILNLTDTEYAELVHRFVTNASESSVQADNEVVQQKISELELLIKQSRDFEDAEKQIIDKEAELSFLNNELSSVESINAKYHEARTEYSKYGKLTQFNLAKMHLDLVAIMDEITHAEEELLSTKSEQIRRTTSKSHFDKGKIGMAIGWTFAVLICSVILYVINVPFSVIAVGLFVGLLLAGLLLYTAKVEADYPLMDAVQGANSLQLNLRTLQAKKIGILQLVGVKSTDDFFHLKAKLGSCVKTIKYYKDLLDTALQGKEFNEMRQKRQELQSEILALKKITTNESHHLSSEIYLATYRQIDSLKLQLGQLRQNVNLDKNQIVSKLASIRNELEVKLPGYKDLLKNNFKASFVFIKKHLDELALKLGISPINIDAEGFRFGQLSYLEKTLVNYALIKNIYKQNFVFAIENTSEFGSDREILTKFVDIAVAEQAVVYFLDEKALS